MKVLILAGGLGSRLSEETISKPKPLIEIGGKPILWHIMKTYSLYGFNEFVILCGYKGYMIKDYFVNYFNHMSDMTINMKSNEIIHHENSAEPWEVTLIDTGLKTLTGSRLKMVKDYVGNKPFMLTYGDGVSDININKLLQHHRKHGKLATMTSVQPEGRFGSVDLDHDNKVISFKEKPVGTGSWVNVGYFVCQPEVLNYIPDGKNIPFERDPLENLAKDGQLYTYKHKGFWRPMDTQRDKSSLEDLIETGNAPWIKW